jgi:hypothetical protein
VEVVDGVGSGDAPAPHLQPVRTGEVFDSVGEDDTRAPHRPPAREVEVPAEAMEWWTEWGGAEVEEVLASGAVVLLDAQWLIELARSGGVLKPRQALPKEAFLSLSEIKAAMYVRVVPFLLPQQSLAVVCISHCWYQANHPDPHGHNLRLVARALQARLEFLKGWGNRAPRLAVFYDFCSTHQKLPRPRRRAAGHHLSANFSYRRQAGRRRSGPLRPGERRGLQACARQPRRFLLAPQDASLHADRLPARLL